MKTLTVLTGTLGAVAIGVALGVLFAPLRGSETRIKITRKGHEYADYFMDGFDDMIDFVSHSIESVENGTSQLAKKGKDQAKKMTSDF